MTNIVSGYIPISELDQISSVKWNDSLLISKNPDHINSTYESKLIRFDNFVNSIAPYLTGDYLSVSERYNYVLTSEANALCSVSDGNYVSGIKQEAGKITKIYSTPLPSLDPFATRTFVSEHYVSVDGNSSKNHKNYFENDITLSSPTGSALLKIFANGGVGFQSSNRILGLSSVNSEILTFAPTPQAGDISEQIATTRFVYGGDKYVYDTLSTLIDELSAKISEKPARPDFSVLYPVGSLFLSLANTLDCPIKQYISNSTWKLVALNKCLWGSNNGENVGEVLSAGLPNHTHKFNFKFASSGSTSGYPLHGGSTSCAHSSYNNETQDPVYSKDININGKAKTVQPPALVVNIWERIK